jgi:hypothetical protein
MLEITPEEDLLAEMVAYRRRITGLTNTVFISTRGNARHAAGIKLAIDPPYSLDPRAKTASIAISDYTVTGEPVNSDLLAEVSRFIDINRQVLLEYWNYKIDTDELGRRLKPIK